MDEIDRQILGILATDGRASFSHIGRVVGLSTNAAASRVRRLEGDGVILGYRAVLADAAEVDVPVTSIEAFVDIRLREGVDSEGFLDWAGHDPAVLDAVHVTGLFDYLLRIRVSGTADLDRFLRRVKSEGGAGGSQTRIALRPRD
ncbi:Lrp/AsnC family transcriptional regulator [Gordonia polyisoprenivorans]|uniref:Lrp/AsnC family transcriptional regulator n=1 Tax=Gordonia polyisoprenivorans TaxID=84595 RepID=UPI001AD6F958|nr:Lrp/AsnC family transcriptional regulator [Gordonia polyisoprenivorans]QTI67435.1 Lrp/AsnC family transcriptional regulator [Gordonia polyisoprenivorans]